MNKHAKSLSVLLLCSVILTGCWDRREINDVAFVLASAIDFEENQYKATVQIALPGQMGGAKGGGGGTSGGKSYVLESASADTVHGAVNKQQKASSRQLYFAHRRLLVIGEEMAREGIEPIMDALGRIPQNRLQSYVVISKGPAEKLLAAEAPLEQYPGEMIREMAVSAMKSPRSIKHVLNIVLSDGVDLALPTVLIKEKQGQEEKPTISVDGLAVFNHENKLTGYISGDEADGALWAMNEANRPELIVNPPRGEGKIVLSFQQNNVSLKPEIQGNKVKMHLELQCIGIVVENESNFELSEDGNIHEVEEAAKKKLISDIQKGIKSLQSKKSDAVGFGKVIYNQKPNDWQRLKEAWYDIYPMIQVEIKAQVHIEHSGAVVSPLGRKDRSLTP